MASISDVKLYWDTHPLLSYELAEPGTPAFFDDLNRAKVNDVDRFTARYWNFTGYEGKKVLDVGCGPGWITVNYANPKRVGKSPRTPFGVDYARKGAKVTAIDISTVAVHLTRKYLDYKHVNATVMEGNAERLPFPDNSFDLVVSSGVLHHTPDTMQAIRECYRVLKFDGTAKITLYRKGILHNPAMFGLTRGVMRILSMKHPGSGRIARAGTVDEFIRQYDGASNPVGIAKTNQEWLKIMKNAGFIQIKHENHVFPARFVTSKRLPSWLHRFLDRHFGLMVYFEMVK